MSDELFGLPFFFSDDVPLPPPLTIVRFDRLYVCAGCAKLGELTTGEAAMSEELAENKKRMARIMPHDADDADVILCDDCYQEAKRRTKEMFGIDLA